MEARKVTGGQSVALKRLFDNKIALLNEYLGKDYRSFGDTLYREWRDIRDAAYPCWREDDWEVGQNFRNTLTRCADAIERKNGQMFFNF